MPHICLGRALVGIHYFPWIWESAEVFLSSCDCNTFPRSTNSDLTSWKLMFFHTPDQKCAHGWFSASCQPIRLLLLIAFSSSQDTLEASDVLQTPLCQVVQECKLKNWSLLSYFVIQPYFISCHLQHFHMLAKIPKNKAWSSVTARKLRPPLLEVFIWKRIRKITRVVTYRSIPLKPSIFQEEEREKRHPAWVHLPFCSAQTGLWMRQSVFSMLSSGVCQNTTRFWLLGGRTTGMKGGISCHRQSCATVCSGILPFYLYELAAIFHCAGPSPRETISEGNLSKPWWKLSCYLPLLIRLGYMGHMKNAATHKTVRRNPSTDNKTVQRFIFLHFTSLRVATYASQAAVKPFASRQGWGHLINHVYSHLGSRFGWKMGFQQVN